MNVTMKVKMTTHFENTFNLSMDLCGCLLFVVGIIGASFQLPSSFNMPIDHFINDLNDAVTTIYRKRECQSYLWIRKSCLLTDSLQIPLSNQSIGRQSIKICNYNVTAAISLYNKRIWLKSPNFALSVLYFQNTEASAVVQWIRATKYLSGTQTMHIVHDILPRLGVWDVSLENCARLSYKYQDDEGKIMKTSISLIKLRCIRGKTTDWYGEFGYFNCNRDSIACRMHAIYHYLVHDTMGNLRGVTLGPFLSDLWNMSDKTEFHEEYRKVSGVFRCLVALRDEGKWRRTFKKNQFRINCSMMQIHQ